MFRVPWIGLGVKASLSEDRKKKIVQCRHVSPMRNNRASTHMVLHSLTKFMTDSLYSIDIHVECHSLTASG